MKLILWDVFHVKKMKKMKKTVSFIALLLAMLLMISGCSGDSKSGDTVSHDGLHASIQHESNSPEWVTQLSSAQDEAVTQLFVVAGLDMEKTTASISMHQRDKNGNWKQILSTRLSVLPMTPVVPFPIRKSTTIPIGQEMTARVCIIMKWSA